MKNKNKVKQKKLTIHTDRMGGRMTRPDLLTIKNTLEKYGDDLDTIQRTLSNFMNQVNEKMTFKRNYTIVAPRWFLKNREHDWCIESTDHFFKVKSKNLYGFEPYQLDVDDLREIVNFCDEQDVNVRIDGFTNWFSGRTCRVLFSERGKKK